MSPVPRTPILVGVGQLTQHEPPAGLADGEASSAVDLAGEAARRAIEDTGAGDRVKAAIDTVMMVRTFADSTPRRAHQHGAVTNPPRSVGARAGADPARAVYAEVGGNTPQALVNEAAEAIAVGSAECVLLAGGEPLLTLKAAAAAGIEMDWGEEVDGQLEDRGFGTLWINASEIAHGVTFPIQVYPLFEQAIRARRGATVDRHLRSMAELFAPFSEVAAQNPFAAKRVAFSVDELATPEGDNRYVVFPYPRRMNARDTVDQAAAVILTSVGRAEALGIQRDRWVFLHGCADVADRLYVVDRVDLAISPAIRVLGERALGMAGIGIDDVAHVDLYSCFPSAVEVAAEALGLAEDDPRGLTLTGGLPFFGGPGNDYSLHAIAEAVGRCRDDEGSYALVTANGGALTKHSAGVYSTRAPSEPFHRVDPAEDQRVIDALDAPASIDAWTGPCTVETSSVVMERDGATPKLGIVLARTPSGERFAANATDADTLAALMGDEMVGLEGRAEPDGEGRNLVTI